MARGFPHWAARCPSPQWEGNPIKILWHSNAPAPMSQTGYGYETALFAPRIAALGHDVVLSCMTGMSGFPTEWEGIPCLPGGLTAFSADILPEHAKRFFGRGPGLIITHYDVWALGPESVRGFATAGWSPVHSNPMSAGDQRFYNLSGAQPIAYSRFGERMMRQAGMDPLYVPHGIDARVFRPLDERERRAARRLLGVPDDAFVISVVAANKGTDPPRKAWGEHLAAFAAFRKRHPDAVMLIHSLAATPHEWGLDMRPLIANLGIGNAVLFSDEYAQVTGLYSDEYMRGLLGCSDVFSNPSYGEGFGIPAMQAQACGIPVIVGDNSAQSELCGAGWKVACQPYWHHRDEAWWAAPQIKSITACMEKAYRARGNETLKARAREFALAYDADLVATTYWKPALDMLGQLAGAERVKPANGGLPLPTHEADGFRWVQRGPHTDDWIAIGHEEALAPVLEGLLPDGGTFLDVGAHVGRWSLRLARRAERVVAVEANPDTAAVLRYNLSLNDVRNVDVVEVAAWDEHTKLALELPFAVTSGSTRTVPGEGGEIDAAPLDDVLLRWGRFDLVKLDVEGADLHALRGMAQILATSQPVLLVEDHSMYGYYEHDDLIALLHELGYETEPIKVDLAGDRVGLYVIAKPPGPVDD